MSELKALVDGLRGLEASELRSLLTRRMVNLSGVDDLYSLAEVLNSPKSYGSIIGSLSASQLESLAKLSRDEKISSKALLGLSRLFLVYNEGQTRIFGPLLEQLKAMRAFTRAIPVIETDSNRPDQKLIDDHAGVAMFETMQALTEIIFDLEKHLVREVGRGSVGLPDVKRLASALACSNERAKQFFSLASSLGLTVVQDGRHRLTSKAITWLEQSNLERFDLLLIFYRELLGEELAEDLRTLNAGFSLRNWLMGNFPLADTQADSRIGRIQSLAEDFGLVHETLTTSWFNGALAGDAVGLMDAVNRLPEVQGRIILQGDGTIVAPGPLPTKLESALRKIATTESIGLASTYRLSALSLTHGLELGLTIEDIRELLVSLSGTKLPQPVDYLLSDVEKRFGRLLVGVGGNEFRSQISSPDALLLTEIASDSRLKPFAVHRMAPELLACRFEPSVVYFGLRECGYLAIRVDKDGRVLSPVSAIEPAIEGNEASSLEEKIAKLLDADRKLTSGDSDEVLIRQVQLAIRNRAMLLIKVNLADGGTTVFELQPSGIANGRLRGKDRKAQIERTLPLSTIASIELA